MNIPSSRILIIHLEALGAVLRSTALLAPIKRKFPNSHITWITQKPADQLLTNNPMIDRILSFDFANVMALKSLEFDACFCIDKSIHATALADQISAELKFGFKISVGGAILPASASAEELWDIGLSNQKKFFENEKTETQLTCEALELGPFGRDAYVLKLSDAEILEVQSRRLAWGKGSKTIVGLNTGCSQVISAKKMSVKAHRELIQILTARSPNLQIVLLGGKEDEKRNKEISEGLNVTQSPTDKGLRDGVISCDACDIIVSGDSLGMHIGIALKKWVVAWFGPTCSQEIDLYDRGVHVISDATCGPCWKRFCDKSTMCYDLVDLEKIYRGIVAGSEKVPSTYAEHPHYSDRIHR